MMFSNNYEIKTYEIDNSSWGWRLFVNSEIVDGSFNYSSVSPTEIHALNKAFNVIMVRNNGDEKFFLRNKRFSKAIERKEKV